MKQLLKSEKKCFFLVLKDLLKNTKILLIFQDSTLIAVKQL